MTDPTDDARGQTTGVCPNCGAATAMPYCGQCGQPQACSLTVRDWFGGVLQGLSSADGRLWRTARMLLLRPGQLELDWARGCRKRFMSPTSVYMFAAALLFFVTAVVPSPGNVFGDFARGVRDAGGDEVRATVEQVQDLASTSTRWILILGMVPALAGMTRGLFGRRGDHFASHLVASLHLHAVMFLGLTVILLLLHGVGLSRDPDLSSGMTVAVLLPLLTAYLVVQSWRIHRRRWFSIVPRTLIVVASYIALFALVASLLVAVAGQTS